MQHQEWSGCRTFYIARMYNYDSSLRRKRIFFYNILSIFQHAGLCKTDNELKIKTVSNTFYKRVHKPVKSRSCNELFVWVLLGRRRAELDNLGLEFCSFVWEEDRKKGSSWGRDIDHLITALQNNPRISMTEIKICFVIIFQFKLL